MNEPSVDPLEAAAEESKKRSERLLDALSVKLKRMRDKLKADASKSDVYENEFDGSADYDDHEVDK